MLFGGNEWWIEKPGQLRGRRSLGRDIGQRFYVDSDPALIRMNMINCHVWKL